VVQRLRELTRPVIAAVNGTAAGAGAVIALASDFRLLSRGASFRFLFTKVGLAGADMGCAYLLPRLVGLGRATEILMLGEKVTADEARAIGLATRVVADDLLLPEAQDLARRLADGPTFAYAATKSLLTRELDMSLPAAIEMEAWVQALLMRSDDHAEFYAAFRQGRDPNWTGR
jgi:enoyl-CoA hydratase/carnithine racemase